MADDGVIDVGGGCDFDGGDAEGRASAIDASDAAASDTGGAEADEEQEENPQGAAGAFCKDAPAFAERKKEDTEDGKSCAGDDARP